MFKLFVGGLPSVFSMQDEDEVSPHICCRSARAAIAQASPPEGDEEEAAAADDMQQSSEEMYCSGGSDSLP